MKNYLYLAVLLVLVAGCNSAERAEGVSDDLAMADTVESSTDTLAVSKVIQTADMRIRVRNVLKAREQLSKSLKSLNGTIVESKIESHIIGSEKMAFSADSLLEVSSYTSQGFVEVRVPAERLEDFLDMATAQSIFVHEQSLKRDDQQFRYLSNRLLAGNRKEILQKTENKRGVKSKDLYTAMSIKDDYVQKKVENLEIDNRVKYSTVTLALYQENSISKIVIGNDRISDYRPPFFKRLGMSLLTGWAAFKEVIIFLANLWVLPVIGLVIYVFLRHARRNRMANSKL